jgi:uncharacterized protein (TIGR02145 family)
MMIAKSIVTVTTTILLCIAIACTKNLTGPDNNTQTVTDIDGNIYMTIKIGTQEWMAENLRTTRYNDGTPIQKDTSEVTWYFSTSPKYCYYNNTTNADSIKKYGALYNWYVIDPRNPQKLAPTGWHVPTDSDWSVLENYLVLNGYNWDGTTDTSLSNKIAKSLASKTSWQIATDTGAIGCDLGLNNRSGFSALPGGWRYGYGVFSGQDSMGYWWSSTEIAFPWALDRCLSYGGIDSLTAGNDTRSCGLSVRFIRDN